MLKHIKLLPIYRAQMGSLAAGRAQCLLTIGWFWAIFSRDRGRCKTTETQVNTEELTCSQLYLLIRVNWTTSEARFWLDTISKRYKSTTNYRFEVK